MCACVCCRPVLVVASAPAVATRSDPNIQTRIVKGIVNRVFTICSEKHIEEELQFLIDMFVENDYGMSAVKRVITQVRERRTQNNRTAGGS